MKKFLLLMFALVIALTLSGCNEDLQYTEPPQDDWPYTVKYAFCSKNGNYSEPYCVEFWEQYDLNEGRTLSDYYTQEEVDELLYVIEHWAEMNDVQLEDLWEEINLLEQRIEELEQFELLVEEWGLEIEAKLEPLECDNDCVIENIDNEILIATIGMIDILIYQYENTTEELTEEDEFIYNLLLMQRQELIGEIE